MGRGSPNIEDHIRAALALATGLDVVSDSRLPSLQESIRNVLTEVAQQIAASEAALDAALTTPTGRVAWELASRFLLGFAHRSASRDRLHVFTTNYDRLIEFACDLAGLRVIDRFVGSIRPVFRSTRVDVDLHYNPPGIRGEPRYLEGVVRLEKLHGSLDWRYLEKEVVRDPIRFGMAIDDLDAANLMIYPNPAKDIETTEFPYAELFRDFSAAACRPNASTVTFGYGFGDSHINRVLSDILTVPGSTLLIISHGDPDGRIAAFVDAQRNTDQLSYLVGPRLGGLESVVRYLPSSSAPAWASTAPQAAPPAATP
jgi:hypothetical protein